MVTFISAMANTTGYPPSKHSAFLVFRKTYHLMAQNTTTSAKQQVLSLLHFGSPQPFTTYPVVQT
jgi:hypothetical protein